MQRCSGPINGTGVGCPHTPLNAASVTELERSFRELAERHWTIKSARSCVASLTASLSAPARELINELSRDPLKAGRSGEAFHVDSLCRRDLIRQHFVHGGPEALAEQYEIAVREAGSPRSDERESGERFA
jgi:hypothetical protein